MTSLGCVLRYRSSCLTTVAFYSDLQDALSLWVRHHAWLNTTPEKEARPRKENRNNEMPPIAREAIYIIEILFDIGPVNPVGMGGLVGISDQDIYYYQKNQGIKLTAWECFTLKLISKEYASMMSEAKERNCPAPYIPFTETLDRKSIQDGFLEWASKLSK